MSSAWVVAAAAAAGVGGAGFVLRHCAQELIRALLERCRRRTITETAAALEGGGVVMQSNAEGDTLFVARPVVPPQADPQPGEPVLDAAVVEVRYVVGRVVVAEHAATAEAAEAGR